jgi:hypothetical protein
VLAVSATALLIVMFAFSWYEVDVPASIPTFSADLDFNAWDAFDVIDYGLLAVVVIALGAGLVVALRPGDLALAAGVIAAGAGVAGFLVVAYRVAEVPTLVIDDFAIKEEGGVEISSAIGAYVGLVALAGIAIGGWLSIRSSGTSLREGLRRLEQSLGEEQEPGQGSPPPRAPAG